MADAEPSTHVDYFQKLHQQIVQKDNIIKILQAQLEGAHAHEQEAATLDELSDSLGEAEARLAEYEDREDEGAADHRRLLELEAELDELRDLEEEHVRLKATLSLTEEELARHKELLEGLEKGGDGAEVLRARVEEQAGTIAHLERELGAARERAGKRRGGPEDAGEAERLRARVADLEAALDVARETVEHLQQGAAGAPVEADGLDLFALARELIEGLQVLEDLESELYSDGEALEGLAQTLQGLAAALGMERIPTVGETFDPEVHTLGRVQHSEDGTHDSVVAEEVPGYRIGERVVKLAQVTVVRNPYFCERCRKVSVAGASFCHLCGGRIALRRSEGRAAPPTRRPRDEARRLLDMARSAARRGDERAAREKLLKALDVAPEDSRVLLEVALLEEEQGSFQAARERVDTLPETVPGLKDLARHRNRIRQKCEILDRLRTVR